MDQQSTGILYDHLQKTLFFEYLCDMDLTREICMILDDAAVPYTVETACGREVIFTGKPSEGIMTEERFSAAIIPASINAADTETAGREAESLQSAISQTTAQTGIYPLTITEDRWHSQHEMMQSRLLAHLQIFTQIYARNCEIKKIDKQTAAEFLDKNHSYGDAKCRYRYGLYLKRHTGHNAGDNMLTPGTLVAVATFSNARKWIKGDKTIRSYEWTRYASLSGVRLSGGMGKLLNAFIEEVNPDDIMTYADLEWSEGRVYETLGFALEGFKEPVSFYVDASWRRFPIKPEEGSSLPEKTGNLFYQNLGSNKYRLKLTDYQ